MSDDPDQPFARQPLTSLMLNWRLVLLFMVIGFLMPIACVLILR